MIDLKKRTDDYIIDSAYFCELYKEAKDLQDYLGGDIPIGECLLIVQNYYLLGNIDDLGDQLFSQLESIKAK